MFGDSLKVVVPLLGGGLAGALLNEWFRRRSGKLQSIPLIERVNRRVGPELKGFTLARIAGDPDNPHLEKIKDVREYQFTLRNSSTIHLQDVEIQFEFPSKDTEAWASRPLLSNAAPVLIDAIVSEPQGKGFRWRLPHLPCGDSIEFNFKAVNPSSPDYDVALYKADRVVIKKSKGEPTEKRHFKGLYAGFLVAATGFAIALASSVLAVLFPDQGQRASIIRGGGCTLTVSSSYERFAMRPTTWPWSAGPWQISDRLVNAGAEKCLIQSDQIGVGPVVLAPGEDAKKTLYTDSRPRLITRQISLGTARPDSMASVELYGEVKP